MGLIAIKHSISIIAYSPYILNDDTFEYCLYISFVARSTVKTLIFTSLRKRGEPVTVAG